MVFFMTIISKFLTFVCKHLNYKINLDSKSHKYKKLSKLEVQ